jgi:hypothetical protein
VILTAIFAKPASQTDFFQSRPKNPGPQDISWIWRAIGVIVSVLHYVDMASYLIDIAIAVECVDRSGLHFSPAGLATNGLLLEAPRSLKSKLGTWAESCGRDKFMWF